MYSKPRATLKYIGIRVKIGIAVHGIAVHWKETIKQRTGGCAALPPTIVYHNRVYPGDQGDDRAWPTNGMLIPTDTLGWVILFC